MPFSIVRNDIAQVHAEVLVNAANEHLAAGGGVCGAIFDGAGFAQMQRACGEIGGCPTGSAIATPGFRLPCRWVVHAVGPVWRGGAFGEERLLRSCYRSVFAEVDRLGATSVAYPLISAGIYGYPVASALRIAREETAAYLESCERDVQVTLVVFSRDALRAATAEVSDLQAYIDDAYVAESPFVYERRSELAAALPAHMLGSVPMASEELADHLETVASDASDLNEALDNLDAPFSTTLLALIDARGMTDAEVYKRANISRQLFSKIRSNPGYRPAKPTAVALGLALGLDYDGLQDLLARAGFTLSHSSKFDVIIEFFVERGEYDLFRINEALFTYDQPLLGSA